MSGAASTARPDRRWERLPERLRPREQEIGSPPARGDLRRVESTLLVLACLVLVTATVYDLVREVHVNERLTADLRTWRAVTGHTTTKNISIEQDLTGYTTRDVLCANTWPAPPGTAPQVCLIMTGPVIHGVRAAKGGFYLPPYLEDVRVDRYACFGTAVSEGLCGEPTPPGAPDTPLTGG